MITKISIILNEKEEVVSKRIKNVIEKVYFDKFRFVMMAIFRFVIELMTNIRGRV